MKDLQDAKESIEKARKIAEECPYRPKYHFLPKANWMNDPNGPIFYKGEFHLFYQHNPYGEQWGNIHWGHAKSKDLVHWQHLPIALVPNHELGEEHCFSGCCVNNDGIPSIIYTSIGPERLPSTGAELWMATSLDDMKTWQKSPHNPLMTIDIHGDLDIREWRDPYIWKENKYWYMTLGGHIHNSHAGIALLYRSKNLIEWEYLNPLCIGNKDLKLTGKNWECPNFFPLKDKHILIISPHKRVVYSVGTYKDHKFTPGNWRILDHGRVFYAPTTMVDKNGRIIVWGWVKGGGTGGWNGCLTLPRIISMGKDGKLEFSPASELQKLRDSHINFKNLMISSESNNILESIRSHSLEILGEFQIIDVNSFGIQIFKSSQNKDYETIGYDLEKNQLWAGKERSKIDFKGDNKKFIFHIFIDNSVIEIFLNHKECMTSRIYPKSINSDRIEIFCNGGKINIESLDIWTLKTIW
ncbi:MAG: glycoside hydrolase family 32 protein [Promethearchaeota archaeon]|nr:MAG: glycoside hydrolase family 32 protein [Candidatus Lokiarchaeota archaeon]